MRTNWHMYVPGERRIQVAQRGNRMQRTASLINERAVRPVTRDGLADPGSGWQPSARAQEETPER